MLTPDETARRSAEAMLAGDQASLAAGIELVDVGPGTATATMTVRADMVNGHDIAHGGYVFLLADTAFAVACNSYGQSTVAAGCDIAFVAPVHAGDRLTARGPRDGTGPVATASTTSRYAGRTAPSWPSCAAAAAPSRAPWCRWRRTRHDARRSSSTASAHPSAGTAVRWPAYGPTTWRRTSCAR